MATLRGFIGTYGSTWNVVDLPGVVYTAVPKLFLHRGVGGGWWGGPGAIEGRSGVKTQTSTNFIWRP